MLILAIETSGQEGSVAVLQDALPAASKSLAKGRTAQDLAPAIDQLWRQLGIRPAEVDLIAVSTGPGSFTGLRIGITTAKTLAYALGCEILGIDSLDAIAARAAPNSLPVDCSAVELDVVVDAQRQELFVGRFRRTSAGVVPSASPWIRCGVTEVLPAALWLAQLAPQTAVTGTGLKRLLERMPARAIIAPAEVWQPTAESIGALAFAAWQSGRRSDLFTLGPTYLRPSYADEKIRGLNSNNEGSKP